MAETFWSCVLFRMICNICIIVMLMLTPPPLLSTSPVPYRWFRLLSVLWLLWRSYRHRSHRWVYWTTGKDREGVSSVSLILCNNACAALTLYLSKEIASRIPCWKVHVEMCVCMRVCVCVSPPCVCFMSLPSLTVKIPPALCCFIAWCCCLAASHTFAPIWNKSNIQIKFFFEAAAKVASC